MLRVRCSGIQSAQGSGRSAARQTAADARRQVFADADGFTAIVCAPAEAKVYPTAEAPPATASDDNKVVPAWIA